MNRFQKLLTFIYLRRYKRGGEVAVKVQRPAILETVTLDLLVIRNLVEAAAKIPTNGNAALEQVVQNATGLLPVLDVAAERFLEELDYNLARWLLTTNTPATLNLSITETHLDHSTYPSQSAHVKPKSGRV